MTDLTDATDRTRIADQLDEFATKLRIGVPDNDLLNTLSVPTALCEVAKEVLGGSPGSRPELWERAARILREGPEPAPEEVVLPCTLTWDDMDWERIRRVGPDEANKWDHRLDAPCPACGHIVMAHAGHGNPELVACVLCRLETAVPA